MSKTILKSTNGVGEQIEEQIINMMKPEFNFIASNPVRASIIHMLVKAEDLNHSMQVEEISFRTGKRHSVIIYHLEQLVDWKLVEIVKNGVYGNKNKRSIWGLNLKYPNLIHTVYGRILKFFYTQSELDKMCNVNQNVRKKR